MSTAYDVLVLGLGPAGAATAVAARRGCRVLALDRRAVRRRRELIAAFDAGGVSTSVWRRTWIAYPEYWAA